jgi:hypothetical protein
MHMNIAGALICHRRDEAGAAAEPAGG